MNQDRTNWGASEYADALNGATAVELLELAQEVNEKWTATGDIRTRGTASDSAAISRRAHSETGQLPLTVPR